MDIPLSHRKPEAEKFFSEKLGINTYIPLLIEKNTYIDIKVLRVFKSKVKV